MKGKTQEFSYSLKRQPLPDEESNQTGNVKRLNKQQITNVGCGIKLNDKSFCTILDKLIERENYELDLTELSLSGLVQRSLIQLIKEESDM